MSLLGTLQVLAAAAGLALTRWSPTGALFVFVCAVGPVSSLAWHLGLPNFSVALPFLLGYSFAPRRRALDRTPPAVGRLWSAACLYATFLTVATLLALARELAVPGIGDLLHGLADGRSMVFNVGGTIGIIQSWLVALIGPVVLVRAVGDLRKAGTSRIQHALIASLVVVVASIVLQSLWLDPTVRPDLGRTSGSAVTGIVGFFQDPHSLAAYLLLLSGAILNRWVATRRSDGPGRSRGMGQDVAFGLLLAAGLVCLVLTDSRSGVLALAVAWLGILAARSLSRVAALYRTVPGEGPEAPDAFPARRLAGAFVALAFVALLLVPVVRQPLATALGEVGATRLGELLTSRITELPAFEKRLLAWDVGARTILSYPIWGLGPPALDRLSEAGVSAHAIAAGIDPHNLHNYFLQIAAQFGIPALVAFLAVALAALWPPLRMALRGRDRGTSSVPPTGVVTGQTSVLLMCLVSHPLLIVEIQAYYWIIAAWGFVASTTTAAGNTRDPDC